MAITGNAAGAQGQLVQGNDGTGLARNLLTDTTGALVTSSTPTAVGVTFTDGSGAIVAADTSEEVFAANTSRKYLLIQNVSDTDMWINFGTAAVKNQPSILIVAGASAEWSVGGTGVVPTAAVNIICGTISKAYTAKEA